MRYVILGTLAIILVAFAARDAGAQPRTCVRADVAESFILPDGSTHPAGALRVCLDRDYSPVAGLHSIATADGGRGRFLSRRMKPEGTRAQPPQLAFVRDAAGELVLRGYTVQRKAYWLEAPRGKGDAPSGSQVAKAPATETVWLAAVVTP